MDGMLALKLVQSYGLKADKIILIGSNLCPAAAFYRTLLMPDVANVFASAVDMINA